MRLLRLSDVETNRSDRVFEYSRFRASLLACIELGATAALLLRAFTTHWNAGYYIAAVLIFFGALTQRYITARFRPTNWLVRMNDLGMFIQFRSYLNYHLPVEDFTVVFLSYGEIRSARLLRERARVPDAEGHPATQIRRYVELDLAGDTAELIKALRAEMTEKAPVEKRWYGSSSTLYEDHPVRMESPPFLQIRWQAVPRAEKFLDALRPNTSIAEPVQIAQDFLHLDSLSPDEQQKRLRELAEKGEIISAVYLAQKLYSCGLAEAREKIEKMRQGAGAGV